MKRRHFLFTLAALASTQGGPAAASNPQVHVFKSPTCGCCSAWARHMRSAGFAVTTTDVPDTAPERRRLGMPERFAACHTASVEGYAIEGHVPAEQVRRLLESRPAAIGLAVLGMPLGSPGMEVDGRADPYEVLLVDRRGQATTFAKYPK